ncbi:MAG: FemAB family PEP-CTERM system-associated protein [Gammaproteobacteria bacterium]|nr:MAG: FemAB family PEP-CTERM system-associated protein [Gammaproteobacteria bacterium]
MPEGALAADAAPRPALRLAVRELGPADAGRWDAFVQACPEATFFHRAGWARVLEEAFGHRPRFLYAERGGRIEGVLPLAEVRSLLMGHALISSPFCVYGGVAAASEEARRALLEAAAALARERGVDYLELRHLERRCPGWPCQDRLYVTFRKALDPDPERNLLAVPRKQRAMIRKGIQAGLRAEPEEGVDTLHRVYARSVRRLGTPVFARSYFALLREVFGEACEVLVVYEGREPVAAVLSFVFRDEILPYYGGGTERARQVKGNDFMYWEVMRRAAARGLRRFDYGRSKVGTGSYAFKKNWGFVPEPLHYEYRLVKARRVPEVNPLNPRYRLFVETWKRLPLPLTLWLGPRLIRHLG